MASTKLYQYAYGVRSADPHLTPLEVELTAFRDNPPAHAGGLGRDGHFWNIAAILWGPKCNKHFVRHPWAEKMIYHAARRKYLGVSGAGSSGKTDTFACWGLVNWLADPLNTMVIVTSTSLKDSRKRIWGSITSYYQAAPELAERGKLIDSVGSIRALDDAGNANNDKAGIGLIPGAKSKERDAIGTLIGMKNKNVILIADELPELSEALMEAAFSNLALNPHFSMVGIGNFASIYDPFGVFVRPKKGYDSISIEDEEWETEKGFCIRFDGMKSPNILEGRDKSNEYPIYNSRNLKEHRETLGENSARFWRMCRSFHAPIGLDNVIYSDAELIAGKAMSRAVWVATPTRICALDPSFTNGGDRSIQLIASYGLTTDGLWTLCIDEIIALYDNAANKAPRDYQIARQLRDNCIRYEVSPENCALDSTAAGAVLLSIVHEEWSPLVLGINFSGYPSEMLVSASDPVTARQKFDRRVSELWWVGREFMKYGQIKGITDDLAREMKARKYDTVKGPDGLKIRVEPKSDMKQRIGFSPDEADCFAIALEICRQRFSATAGGERTGLNRPKHAWQAEVDACQAVYANVSYADPQYAVAEEAPWG